MLHSDITRFRSLQLLYTRPLQDPHQYFPASSKSYLKSAMLVNPSQISLTLLRLKSPLHGVNMVSVGRTRKVGLEDLDGLLSLLKSSQIFSPHTRLDLQVGRLRSRRGDGDVTQYPSRFTGNTASVQRLQGVSKA